MAVTLQAINKSGIAVGSPLTFSATSVSRMVKDKKVMIPLPVNHKMVPLGCEGPTLTLKFKVIGATNYGHMAAWKGGTFLNVTASTMPEMPATVGRTPASSGSTGMNCEVWNVDDCKSDRSGGQVDVWDVQLTLTRYWNWVRS